MRAILTTAFLLVAARAALAVPVASTPLRTLVEGSEVIVVGDISASPAESSGSVEIVKTLKGTPGAQTLTFRWSSPPRGLTAPTTVKGLLFLVVESPGQWVAVPAVSGGSDLFDQVFVVPPGELPSEYSYPPDTEPLDKVVAELRYAVDGSTDDEHLASAFRALLSLQVPGDAGATPHISAFGLEVPESSPTVEALRTVGAALARTIRNRLMLEQPVPSSLSSLLCRVVDPGAVDAAAAVVNTAGVDGVTRHCAMTALRNVHSPAAVPALAAALDSPDMDIAYTALMGLSAYATGMVPGSDGRDVLRQVTDRVVLQYTPSVPTFEQEPAKYLEYWRRWWSCEACKLGEQTCDQAACLGFVATYSAQYDASWTCSTVGQTGCLKNRISFAPVTFKPEPPDAPEPAAVIFTPGYAASYTATYDANWTCTTGGATGCRKNRLSYAVSTVSPTGPDASVPAEALYTYGYVGSWYTGPWSGCSATSCGTSGWYTRTVTPSSWRPDPPDATRPSESLSCGYPCTYTCYDYGLYETWAECYGAGWTYCDTRYRDNGTGGLLTCRHGYE